MRLLMLCFACLSAATPAAAQIWDRGNAADGMSSRTQRLLRTMHDDMSDLRRPGQSSDQDRRQMRRERRELRQLNREYRSADASEREELRDEIEAKGARYNARLVGPAQVTLPSPR